MGEEAEVIVEDVVEEVVYTPQEEEALSKGWKPRDEWDGDDNDFVSAGEFNRRGELLGKIVHQNRKLQQLETTVDTLKSHYSKVQETEYKRALDSLKARKVQALEDEDHAVVADVDEAIYELKQERNTAPPKDDGNQPSAEYQEWSASNPWYMQDVELTSVADGIAKAFVNKHGNTVTEQDVFKHVGNEVRKRYPEKFGIRERQRTSPVESASRAPTKKADPKFTKKDLNDTQREIMHRLVSSKVLTEEQYINDLVSTGELG